MARKRTPKHPEAYPEQFGLLWQAAYEKNLTIPCATKGKAVSLRHQLYAYRASLVEHGYPFGSKIYNVTLSILTDPETGAVSLTTTNDNKLLHDALVAAGIDPNSKVDLHCGELDDVWERAEQAQARVESKPQSDDASIRDILNHSSEGED